MRLEDGLEHDFLCRRSAGSPVLLGSAGGSSELPSVPLLLCAHPLSLDGPLARARVHFLRVACCVLAVE